MADTGTLPGPDIAGPYTWFGLVMNSERVIHRMARRRTSEYTAMVTGNVPYELFRASTHSLGQADREYDRFILSVERAMSDGTE